MSEKRSGGENKVPELVMTRVVDALPWEGGLPQCGCKTSEIGLAVRGEA